VRGAELVALHAWSPTAIDKALEPLMDWDAVANQGLGKVVGLGVSAW
jgi:hypothetical protein